MLWKYRVYDSLTQTTDTVWLSIVDSVTISGNEFVSERRAKRFADTSFRVQFLHFKGAELQISDDSITAPGNERIVFPLELNSVWSGPAAFDDTSTVSQVEQIQVPAGIFDNSALIKRSWNIDFEGGGNWSQTWLAPGVGMVYRYLRGQFTVGGGIITVTTNEVWELIEYDLTTFGLKQFPETVGSRWVYEEIDSIPIQRDSFALEIDTATVTIVDSGVLGTGESYTLWQFSSSDSVYTQFVVRSEKRLSFQNDTSISPFASDVYYDFPLAVGRNWGMVFIAPASEVLDKETVLTPIQRFLSSSHTRTKGGAFNFCWTQDDWLVPGVGIVKSSRREMDFAPATHRTRILIDYQLAN